MPETLIGYARCSTDDQDLTAQCDRLCELGVAEQRIYLDHGLTGTNRARPGLDQALAAVRAVARAKGKLRGKRPKLSPKQQRELVRMAGTGEYTIADLAELFSVSRTTVYRTLQRDAAAER